LKGEDNMLTFIFVSQVVGILFYVLGGWWLLPLLNWIFG